MSWLTIYVFVVGLLGAVVEQSILLLAPHWLARFAFLRLRPVHIFRLPAPRPPDVARLPPPAPVTYRDAALGRDDRQPTLEDLLSGLRRKVDVGDSVLFNTTPARGSLTLRRAFGQQKHMWIVRIDVELRDGDVLLSAREGIFPVVFLLIPPYLVAWMISRALGATLRDADVRDAYALIEQTMRSARMGP